MKKLIEYTHTRGVTGLILREEYTPDFPDLNFSIFIDHYEEELLRRALEELANDGVPPKTKSSLKKLLEIVDCTEDLYLRDICENNKEMIQHFGIQGAIKKTVFRTKGKLLENYVGELFDKALEDKQIFLRQELRFRSTEVEIDLIIACRKAEFYKRLEKLSPNYLKIVN